MMVSSGSCFSSDMPRGTISENKKLVDVILKDVKKFSLCKFEGNLQVK